MTNIDLEDFDTPRGETQQECAEILWARRLLLEQVLYLSDVAELHSRWLGRLGADSYADVRPSSLPDVATTPWMVMWSEAVELATRLGLRWPWFAKALLISFEDRVFAANALAMPRHRRRPAPPPPPRDNAQPIKLALQRAAASAARGDLDAARADAARAASMPATEPLPVRRRGPDNLLKRRIEAFVRIRIHGDAVASVGRDFLAGERIRRWSGSGPQRSGENDGARADVRADVRWVEARLAKSAFAFDDGGGIVQLVELTRGGEVN